MYIRPQDFPWALVNPLVARDVQPNRPLLLAQYGYIPNKKKGWIDKTAQYLSKSTNITTNIAMLSKEGVRRCSISLHFVLETSRRTPVSAPNPCAQRTIFDGKYSTCDMFAVVVWSQWESRHMTALLQLFATQWKYPVKEPSGSTQFQLKYPVKWTSGRTNIVKCIRSYAMEANSKLSLNFVANRFLRVWRAFHKLDLAMSHWTCAWQTVCFALQRSLTSHIWEPENWYAAQPLGAARQSAALYSGRQAGRGRELNTAATTYWLSCCLFRACNLIQSCVSSRVLCPIPGKYWQQWQHPDSSISTRRLFQIWRDNLGQGSVQPSGQMRV